MSKGFRRLVFLGIVLVALNPYSYAADSLRGDETQAMASDSSVEDGQFKCPETLTSLIERTHEMERFLAWAKRHHPEWTNGQIVEFRVAVLKTHKCVKTLENIQSAKMHSAM